jgi:hypothetical protein
MRRSFTTLTRAVSVLGSRAQLVAFGFEIVDNISGGEVKQLMEGPDRLGGWVVAGEG